MIDKVAIVDDDTIFQFTTKVKIEKLGLAKEVMIFNDGEEIFNYIQGNEKVDLPDVILLDINMPLVDGWDFLEMFARVDESKKKNVRIYMLSSSINPVDLDKADANPFISAYITKPIKDEDLKKILA